MGADNSGGVGLGLAVGGKVSAGAIVPWLDREIDNFDLDEDEGLCLVGPMRFFDPVSLVEVWVIPAGTCLENDGRTVIVIDG